MISEYFARRENVSQVQLISFDFFVAVRNNSKYVTVPNIFGDFDPLLRISHMMGRLVFCIHPWRIHTHAYSCTYDINQTNHTSACAWICDFHILQGTYLHNLQSLCPFILMCYSIWAIHFMPDRQPWKTLRRSLPPKKLNKIIIT